jgi:hypothetical protein
LAYDPPRKSEPNAPKDSTEVDLAFNVRPCGTCDFFWPHNPAQQPYGPYPSYDFDSNTPKENEPSHNPPSYLWLKGTTRSPSFPDAEIMDGCRKAPIMTIGINPNLTAFLPGNAGASWCYPSFSNANGTDSWAKYAYYYRYRSVYQEHFDLQFIERFLLEDGRIVAPKPGIVTAAIRPDDSPAFAISVRYDGDARDSTIELPGKIGQPRYVLLVDPMQPHNRFGKGDVIAARLDVPAGHRHTDIYAQQIGYYQRFVPVLADFDKFLRSKGYTGPQLRVGEDVAQLDMVGCASPHWGPQWLGGSNSSVKTIIKNCVSRNAWALKQLLQTRPAVLFLVGEASFSMFRVAFGRLIKSHPALPTRPGDGAFTLLRATTDPAHPCLFEYSGTVDGHRYAISTRIVVTPHFSYGTNFVPQFRINAKAWSDFQKKYRDCADFLQRDSRLQKSADQNGYAVFQIRSDTKQVLATLKRKWPAADASLTASYYEANAMMLGVLEDLYRKRQMTFANPGKGHQGHLVRTDGPCSFCVNSHWKFPLGCPYGKPDETPLPIGLIEKLAAKIAKIGAEPQATHPARRMLDDGFEASRAPPHLL